VPLTIVLIGVSWIDRWEPEPRGNLAFAFLWGAGMAVLIALIVGAEVDNVVSTLGGAGSGYEFFGAVIQAPIVEEGGKGLGLLLIFLVARKHFDGPVDGVVYAAWVAGGFAFTENILYFGSQLVDAGGFNADVAHIFFVRGIMSPFAHVMFTSCTGIALGFAARRTNALGGILAFLIGLVPAMFLHALWNGALYFVNDFYGYYVVVQVPLFIVAILIVRYLRKQEAKQTFDRLTEYAAAGWYGPGEISALATVHGRSQALSWARSHGLAKTMKKYIRDSTKLALTRQRLNTGRAVGGAQDDEAALLASIVQLRTALQAPSTPSTS
jgi:protease PrsW